MNEREYSDLMRKALTDRLVWEEMTATSHGESEAHTWLAEARTKVNADLSRRRADWSRFVNENGNSGSEYRRAQSTYQAWRSAAVGFRGLVEARLSELKERRRQNKKHRLREVVIRFAKTIEAHQAERASDGDLYRLLDETTMPHGLGGRVTLREMLDRLLVGEFA